MKTRISSKGQIVIPKAIRDRRQWHEGTELEIEERGDTLLIHATTKLEPKSIDEVFGMLKYEGPPVSIEEMNAAVDRMFREEWRAE